MTTVRPLLTAIMGMENASLLQYRTYKTATNKKL